MYIIAGEKKNLAGGRGKYRQVKKYDTFIENKKYIGMCLTAEIANPFKNVYMYL